MTIWGKGLQQQQYNTTKQQTQDYETTRRRYATRRLKMSNYDKIKVSRIFGQILPKTPIVH